MKLPIKTRILEMAIESDGVFTAKEFSEELKTEYNGEKTTSIKNIEKQLDMYARVGFLEAEDVAMDDEKQLKVIYRTTQTGKDSVKYIPGHGNKLF